MVVETVWSGENLAPHFKLYFSAYSGLGFLGQMYFLVGNANIYNFLICVYFDLIPSGIRFLLLLYLF